MKRKITYIIWTMAAVLLLVGCQSEVQEQEEPVNQLIIENETPIEESIYQITDEFTTQDNEVVQLADFKGKPTVISMIFTSCGYACPRLTADIQKIEKELGDKAKDINFVLVTFDIDYDTPDVLKEYATTHKFNKNWTLLHGDDSGVQTLSILLNIPFEKDEEGDFSHGNMVTVLDAEGIIKYQKEGLGNEPEPAVEAINQLLAL